MSKEFYEELRYLYENNEIGELTIIKLLIEEMIKEMEKKYEEGLLYDNKKCTNGRTNKNTRSTRAEH